MPSFCKVTITKATVSIHFSFKDFYKAEYYATVEELFFNTGQTKGTKK